MASLGGFLSGLLGTSVDTSGQDQMTQQFMSQLDPYRSRESQNYSGELGLQNQLQRTASGVGPSVAGMQLGSALGDTYRQFDSMGAGARGTGGVLSKYGAMEGLGDAVAKTNAQQAIARMMEQRAAQQQLQQLLAQMGGQSQGMYNANLGGALNSSSQANNLRTHNADANGQASAAFLKMLADAGGFGAATQPTAQGTGNAIIGDGLMAPSF